MIQNKTNDLLVVIVNYFMANDCCRLIESILSSKPMSVRRIVCVDNSCDINQFKQLKLLQNKIKNSQLLVQANSENKGFGAAINTVVNEQFTLDESLTKVLLINPDVELKFCVKLHGL